MIKILLHQALHTLSNSSLIDRPVSCNFKLFSACFLLFSVNEIDCIIENQGNEATVEEEPHDDVLCRSVPTNSFILCITGLHAILSII